MENLFSFVNNQFKPFDIQESIEFAQDFFNEVSYSHFPVLEEGIFLGNISSNDIETFEGIKKLADYKYIFEGFFAKKNAVWIDVLEEFAQNDTNIVPVLDETNAYVGFYELQDVVQFLNETPFLKETGGILVVEKKLLTIRLVKLVK